MDKNDYKTEFEEQRQEIRLEDETPDELVASRTELHKKSKKPKKRSKHKLINMLLTLFTLIPIGILILVYLNWNGPKEILNSEVEDPAIKVETSGKSTDVVIKDTTVDGGIEDKDKVEPEAKPNPKPDPKPEVKPDPKPDPKPEVKPDPKPDPKPEVKPDPKPDPKPVPSSKTHVVAPGETLYRISVNYYGHGNGVDKIRQANGLSSNNISVGQKIVVP